LTLSSPLHRISKTPLLQLSLLKRFKKLIFSPNPWEISMQCWSTRNNKKLTPAKKSRLLQLICRLRAHGEG
jgi:hypothetical protein